MCVKDFPRCALTLEIFKVEVVTRLNRPACLLFFRMNNQDAYLQAYAVTCLGWKCFICNEEAKDQIGIQMQFLGDGQVVFTDEVDGSKWVFCTGCKQAYHLQCVTSCTEQQLEAKGWPFTCTFNECKQVFIQAGHHLD